MGSLADSSSIQQEEKGITHTIRTRKHAARAPNLPPATGRRHEPSIWCRKEDTSSRQSPNRIQTTRSPDPPLCHNRRHDDTTTASVSSPRPAMSPARTHGARRETPPPPPTVSAIYFAIPETGISLHDLLARFRQCARGPKYAEFERLLLRLAWYDGEKEMYFRKPEQQGYFYLSPVGTYGHGTTRGSGGPPRYVRRLGRTGGLGQRPVAQNENSRSQRVGRRKTADTVAF